MSKDNPGDLVKSIIYSSCNGGHFHILCYNKEGKEIADLCFDNLQQFTNFNNDSAAHALEVFMDKAFNVLQ
jgi:hypothetical protein